MTADPAADPATAAAAAAQLVARYRRQRPLRGGSLIVTIFGDAIMPRGGAVTLGSLISLAAPFGLNERLVRTAAARLAKEGWLAGRRAGKRSEYHLSPDGREISWISGRFHPASVLRLNGGALAPTFDFLWIVPGIFFEFLNPPAGYTTELTLMDADGNNVHALTDDQMVIADNQWSFDGTKIIFRETSSTGQGTMLRVLTFDDCQ